MVIATISWCISKKWSIKKSKIDGYRKFQIDLDIEHRAESYEKGNDFLTFQEPDPVKREKEEEEDDLDHINLDIHQDIMDVAQDYLKIFEGTRDKRKGDQKSKRDKIYMQLKDIEDDINILVKDALNHNMQLFDPEDLQHGVGLDEEKAQKRL